ncbi:asparagine synthetase [glutamine-hydrolyzing]-like [Lineus longissimus]|uniref:asparagine synthetase [glutamine-hydrolyzing]-like n=1 Tax=Lineus longissimus TaxID=88925 RepID=UPI002B4F43DA
MCGIWAIFGSDDDVSKQCESCLRIKHRGPDAFRIENVNHFKNCCFGFHHLAIQDDVFGMQPLRVLDYPNLWVIFNGEIYNCDRLAEEFGFRYSTHSDGESILHLYNHGGAEFMAKHLDGIFAFCLLDVKERKVIIGRDTYGVKPCFRFITEHGFLAVCSEVKGLLGLSHTKDDDKIEITPLSPGHIETYDLCVNGKVTFGSKQRFHSIGEAPTYKTLVTPNGECDIFHNIRSLFEAAVEKRLMSMRRIGCLLSGGLDSSLVASLVAKKIKEHHLPYPLQTFSIGMQGSPDVMAARKVSRHIGSEHHEITFTAEEGIAAVREVIKFIESYDITTIRASVGMFLVCKYISQNTDTVVIFSGEGADELAQGYIYLKNAPTPEEAAKESLRLLQDLHYFDVLRADRTTSAWGLECRVPFLDHQFTSYYLSLSTDSRFPKDGVTEKYLIRQAFDSTGLLPKEILWRPKEAFSDGVSSKEKSWFEILQDHVCTLVTDDMFDDAPKTYPFNPPKSKEAFYYRQVFEEFYPGKAELIPYYWMPKWSQTTDPSARTLSVYRDTDEKHQKTIQHHSHGEK